MPKSKGVALVTGAARGIGRDIALRLADDGFDIAVNGLASSAELVGVAEEVKGKGRRVLICEGNISVEQVVADMIKSVVNTLGRLDVMVANAGIMTLDSVLNFTVDETEKTFAINVYGVMLCFKHAAKQMIAQGQGGRLIAASSGAGKRAFKNGFAYSASKFAVRGLMQSAALELGQYGITVNAYAPGPVETRILATLNQGASRAAIASSRAVKRMGDPQDIAHAVSFLASREASYVSGQTLTVDGGSVLS